jgi:hypothetical protein
VTDIIISFDDRFVSVAIFWEQSWVNHSKNVFNSTRIWSTCFCVVIALPYRVFELKNRAREWQQTLVVWLLLASPYN